MLKVEPERKRKTAEKVYGCSEGGHEDGWCRTEEETREDLLWEAEKIK